MIAQDPNQTYDVPLPGYDHLPEDQRPIFTFKWMSRREARDFRAKCREADALSDVDETLDMIDEAISVPLISFKNVSDDDGEIPFGDSRLWDALTDDEHWDLMRGIGHANTLRIEAKKGWLSQSPNNTDESVGDATPTNATEPSETE